MKIRLWLATLAPSTALATGCLIEEADLGADRQASLALPDPDVDPADGFRWAGGVVTYLVDVNGTLGTQFCGTSIDGDSPSGLPFSTAARTAIDTAVARWDQYTPLDFALGTSTAASAPPTLLITRSNNGGHTIGGLGAPVIKCVLIPDSDNARTPAHEIGHAIGLKHEQQRPDASVYIDVDLTCVNPNNYPSYATADADEVAVLGPYDFDSIMHYPGRAGCCAPGEAWIDPDTLALVFCPASCRDASGTCAPVITRKNCSGPGCEIDRPKDVSVGDINTVFRMYERDLGSDEPGDHFGAAAVTGDFDGDGYLDLAVGAPDEHTEVLGMRRKTGVVFLYRGTSERMVAWKKLTTGRATDDGRFGAALAAGDLDGDGLTDLVVGAPGERSSSNNAVLGGNVYLYQAVRNPRLDGNTSHPRYLGLDVWTSYDAAGAGAPLGAYAEFGAALTIADLNGDGRKDLAVGAPGGKLGAFNAGYVAVLRGRADDPGGGTADRPQPWTRVNQGSLSPERHGERFGASLATVNQYGLRSLVVGAPESNVAGASGAAYVFAPWTSGMVGLQELRPPSRGGVLPAMQFGAAVARGSYGASDTRAFVAIGAPEMDGGRGYIYVYTGADGLALEQIVAQAPTAQADRMGGLLTVIDDALGPADALIAGLPRHDKGALTNAGGFRYLYATTASNPTDPFPSPSTLVENPRSNAKAGDHFGSAIATVGLYRDSDGALLDRGLVIGGDGFTDGGGFLIQEPLLFPQPVWRFFNQDSAHPE